MTFRISSLWAALLVTSAPLALHADDSKASAGKHTFSGEITGVVCTACKNDVQTALAKNLTGVVNVTVEPSGKPDVQKLTIVSTSDQVTVDAATKALGDDAKDFHILSLNEKK